MTSELEKKLLEKYPTLFRNLYGDEMKTCMHFGCDHADGWYDLLERTCEKVIQVDKRKVVFFEQVKEKFGQLRIYFTLENNGEEITQRDARDKLYKTVSGIIIAAEYESEETCEICGEPGKSRTSSHRWISTACDECWAKRTNVHNS